MRNAEKDEDLIIENTEFAQYLDRSCCVTGCRVYRRRLVTARVIQTSRGEEYTVHIPAGLSQINTNQETKKNISSQLWNGNWGFAGLKMNRSHLRLTVTLKRHDHPPQHSDKLISPKFVQASSYILWPIVLRFASLISLG
jgi:hypothetical protein